MERFIQHLRLLAFSARHCRWHLLLLFRLHLHQLLWICHLIALGVGCHCFLEKHGPNRSCLALGAPFGQQSPPQRVDVGMRDLVHKPLQSIQSVSAQDCMVVGGSSHYFPQQRRIKQG